MSSRRVIAGVFSVAVVMSAVAAPQAAAAAACQYNRQDLPLPTGATYAKVRGSSTNNSRIVGLVTKIHERGVLWINGTLREMAEPPTVGTNVIPFGVNNTSVVAGYQQMIEGGRVVSKAFRYENNAYELLPVEPGQDSWATGINDAGDVVGFVRDQLAGETTVVVWPRNGARKSFGQGTPTGISAQGKIAFTTYDSAFVVDSVSGTRTELPGGVQPLVLDNERVMSRGWANGDVEITEWDLAGVRVGGYAAGAQPFGKNNSGTVFGTLWPSRTGAPSLWRKSGRTDVVADKLPSGEYYGDVTDAATLIGTYLDAERKTYPARWLWVCS